MSEHPPSRTSTQVQIWVSGSAGPCIGRGGYFGEMALISGAATSPRPPRPPHRHGRHTATATCAQTCSRAPDNTTRRAPGGQRPADRLTVMCGTLYVCVSCSYGPIRHREFTRRCFMELRASESVSIESSTGFERQATCTFYTLLLTRVAEH